MRKRSKYKPRPVLLDNMAYVKEGITPLLAHEDQNVALRARNHGAMFAMVNGTADRDVASDLMGAINMAQALTGLDKRFGRDWKPELDAAHAAIKTMCDRGVKRGRFLFTGEELNAVNTFMAVHDAQLDTATVQDLDRAIATVNKTIRAGKAVKIATVAA
jgi:hypothetical protein